MKAATPRLIFVRHGQTEWSKSGQYTSITDLELTAYGVTQMRATGKKLIGSPNSELLTPATLKHVFTSPRTRARQTVDLLLEGVAEKPQIPVHVDEDLREWEYGDYEGKLTSQIVASRKERGIDNGDWNIWRDGCENGEDWRHVTERVDRLIGRVREIHAAALAKNEPCDVLVVGHGHILRCLAARWVDAPINTNPKFILDAGGVGVLSYQHHNIDEPALYLAGAFVVPVEEADA